MKNLLPLLIGLTACGTLAFPVAAGDSAKPIKVKLKDLDAEMWRAKGEWLLRIDYEIQIKNTKNATIEPLVLLLEVTEDERPVLQEDGLPFQMLVRLDRPTKIKKNKLEYEDAVVVSLGGRLNADPEELDILGQIRLQRTDRVVASDDTDVDFDDGRRSRGIRSFGLSLWGFGGGLGW